MKRLFTSIIAVAFMFAAINTSAFAKDENKINPGITPESILYPIDRLVENIQLKLTTDSAKKVGLLIDISTERFDEAEAMAAKNKEEKSIKALEDGQKAIEDAEKVVADEDVEKDEDLEKSKEKLESFTKKSVERLTEIASREDMPEFAQLVLTRVAAMQQVNYLEKLKRKATRDKDEALLGQLENQLKDANLALETAKTAVNEYKSAAKNERKDNQSQNTETKTKEKEKQNNGQSKGNKGKNN